MSIRSGVRQGGVLSPVLFNLYFNKFLVGLRNKNLGCHIRNLFIGCVMYADDILLLSSSISDLQRMLDICSNISNDLCVNFNVSKSHCISFGNNAYPSRAKLSINNSDIDWCEKISYLGITLVSGKSFKISLQEARRKFFIAANGVLNRSKHATELAKLQLVEAHCLPILLYAMESQCLPNKQVKEINSWVNAIYRKIFCFKPWESVTELICLLGRLNMTHLIPCRTIIFLKRMSNCGNVFQQNLFRIYKLRPEYARLMSPMRVSLTSSKPAIKCDCMEQFKRSLSAS
jgi:hypothetical protein